MSEPVSIDCVDIVAAFIIEVIQHTHFIMVKNGQLDEATRQWHVTKIILLIGN